MSLARRLVFVVVFTSLAWTTVPALWAAVRRALDLAGLPVQQRRIELFGPFFESVLRIGRTLPAGESIALVVEGSTDIGPAVFLNYYLFPRPAKLYFGLGAYRTDPKRPGRIVRINVEQSEEARLMTYEAVRAEEIGSRRVVSNSDLPERVYSRFIVPIATSGDGPPPDRYTTEAVMQNAGDADAHVRIRMQPSNRVAEVVLAPGEGRAWNDLVYQLYSRLDAGWLDIQSDQPIRAQFWFVNPVRKDADEVPFAQLLRSANFPHRPGSRIWVLNPYDRELPIRLNGGEHFLPPRSLIPLTWPSELHVASDSELYAFQSWQNDVGLTEFHWPETE